MQAHGFHQHLVAVGGAVEGAGAGVVIGLRFGFQQFRAADLAFRIQLADFDLFAVGHAAGHRAGGNKHGRNVAEMQCADQQARHDLVAYAQVQRSVEHVMRQGDRGAHGDGVAREQRQLHAGLALRDAVAHGGYAAGELRHAAVFADGVLDDLRETFERLMRRQHVVVGRDDGDGRRAILFQFQLVVGGECGEAVRQIGTGQRTALHPFMTRSIEARQIGSAIRPTTFGDASRDAG